MNPESVFDPDTDAAEMIKYGFDPESSEDRLKWLETAPNSDGSQSPNHYDDDPFEITGPTYDN